ncbi:hypothetical protein BDA96_01G337200 [Sorghum bicolor]|uniref:Uncharacterized protein n=2 Tax=Sorghum bicolor TaxID=4558 RepID=A0A921S2H4_SORBI|nr:hypothetical protein BDA96_01G337200 [Sorghum bicolor]OQU92232.1 hypothetical protein SORBI_3001G314350 [Sorghum bicolor]
MHHLCLLIYICRDQCPSTSTNVHQHVDGGYARPADRRIQEADDRVCQSRFAVVPRCMSAGRHTINRCTTKCGGNQIHIHVLCRVEGVPVYTVEIQEKISCSRSTSSAQSHCMRMRWWSTANVDQHWRIFHVRHHPFWKLGVANFGCRWSQWPA